MQEISALPMKHQYQTITQLNLPRAYLVGTLGGFEHVLLQELQQIGLEVKATTENEFTQRPPSSIAYLFVLVDLSKKLDSVLKVIAALNNPEIKVTVIVGNHTFSPQELEKKHQLITSIQAAMRSFKLNLRLVNLYDLLDKNFDYPEHSPIGKVVTSIAKAKVNLVGDDQQFIYPLTRKDALAAILKIVFSRTSAGKVFDLGGHPVSLLNFSYKVRSLLSGDHYQFVTVDNYRFDNHHLKQSIPKTWNELGWYPEIDITDELKAIVETQVPSVSSTDTASSIETLVTPQEVPTVTPRFSNALESILDYPLIKKTITPTTEPTVASDNTTVSKTIPATPLPVSTPTSLPTSSDKPKKEFHLNQRSNKSTKALIEKPRKTFSLPVKPKLRFTKTKEIFLLFLLVFFTSMFLFVTSVATTIYFSVQFRTALETGNVSTAITNLHRLNTANNVLKPQLKLLQPLITMLIGTDTAKAYYDAYTVIDQTITTANDHSTLLTHSAQLGQTLVGNSSMNTQTLLSNVQVEIESLYYDLGLVTSLLKSNPDIYSITLFGIGSTLQTLETNLSQAQVALAAIQPIIKESPDLLGFSKKKTYMVLLQNNAELRPTGGFIGSFALITFEKGKLLDILVEDVYTADGQLKGYVKPPEPIEQYLGEASWFLRDSNWDFNFPSSAESAAWFLQKEMGIDVDGVIAVNMHVVKDLLEVTGPIMLPDYNETISASNLFERAEYYSEINFFPGSTQKKDFLGNLTTHLKEKILTGDQELWMQVGKSLLGMAQDGELMVYVRNNAAQTGISQLNWSGEVKQVPCLDQVGECAGDYLAIVEANVGVNKANYFVNRKITSSTLINDSDINREVTLSLFNASTQAEWPGGIYKNYVRFYLPENAVLTEVSIDGTPVEESQIRQTQEHGKKVVGFLVQVDVQDTLITSIKYTLPFSNQHQYELYIDKQSGTRGDPLLVEISAETGLVTNSEMETISTNQLRDEAPFNQDKHYRIELAK